MKKLALFLTLVTSAAHAASPPPPQSLYQLPGTWLKPQAYPSTSAGAGLNIPPGVAPSAPVNGDTWTTAAGMYVRINGATVGPLASSAASGCQVPGSNGQVMYNASGACAANGGMTYDGTSVMSLGVAGTSAGGLKFFNGTSGFVELIPAIGALGSSQLKLPAASSDTIAALGLPQTFTGLDNFTGGLTISGANVAYLVGSVVSGHCLQASGTVGGVADAGAACGSGGSGITQLTGDGTAGPGSGSQALTFATVNSNVGSFGDATHVGQFTINAKGLVTGASSVAITATASSFTPGTTTILGATAPCFLVNSASTASACDPVTSSVISAAANAVNTSGGLLTSAVADGQSIVFVGGKLSTSAPVRTVTSSPTIVITDLGGAVFMNVSGGGTFTVPATSLLGNNQTLQLTNLSASTATVSDGSTAIVPGAGCVTASGIPAGATWQLQGNGSTINCVQSASSAGSGITQLTGDGAAGPGSGSQALTISKVNGVAYSATPSTNTVPVVTGSNTVTYEVVPQVALSPSTIAAGTTVSLTSPRQYYVCTGACTVTPPVPAAGYEFCVRNADNVATVITMAALGSSARYENTASTAYGTAGTGTFVSGGAVGDKVCIVGLDATHYLTLSFNGTWTAN